MTLSVNNQLTLLYDILDEQQADCCASVSEYEQIIRLVESMVRNNSISNEQLLSLLPEIYHYGRQGVSAQNMQITLQHIKKIWMNGLKPYSILL